MFDRSMETRLKDKRRTPAVKEGKAPPLRRGRYGALQHDRLGLIGAVCYWARGYKQNVVRLIKKVIHAFGVEKDISAHLFKKTRREAETDHLMTERLVAAIDVLKECRSEQQRLDFRFALSLVAPPRTGAGDPEGCAKRIAARLRVSRGRRSKKRGGRQYSFDAGIDERAVFDEAAKKRNEPLKEGERCMTANGPAELTRFEGDKGCVVTYSVGDVFAQRTYIECYGKEKGSARLRRVPVSLSPPKREVRANSTSAATRMCIIAHVHKYCPTSPHQRDVMRRRLGPFTYEEKAGLIQSDTNEGMFADFKKLHPEIDIKFSQYKDELPWNRKKAYRSTCMDRAEVNFDWHRQVCPSLPPTPSLRALCVFLPLSTGC